MAYLDQGATNRNKVGTANELKAALWLLEQGYYVFNSLLPYGPADIVAWKPETGEILMIDVKTVRRYQKQDGTVQYNSSLNGQKNKKEGVSYLGVCSEDETFIWL